jgi:60 kDa SS-A/Ro ribonucleoprotein
MSFSYAVALSDLGERCAGSQADPIKGRDMVKNSDGCFVFDLNDNSYMERILSFGTTQASYYATGEKLTADAIRFIKEKIDKGYGAELLAIVADFYEKGRAPRQDTVLMVLALLCVAPGDLHIELRRAALSVVSRLRTFSQLSQWKAFHRLASVKESATGEPATSKGFGRAVRNALQLVFSGRSAESLMYQIVKYGGGRTVGATASGKAETWTLKDIVTCAHPDPKTLTPEHQVLLTYIVKGLEPARARAIELSASPNIIAYLDAVNAVKNAETIVDDVVRLVRLHSLPREVLNTVFLRESSVWRALLLHDSGRVVMPITALIRNLATMTVREVFAEDATVDAVCQHLLNQSVLRGGRVHPINLLSAYFTYHSGRGERGTQAWTPEPKIVQALKGAFYQSFGTLKPTKKRTLHCIDASGSMVSARCSSSVNLTACQAAAVMAMVASRVDAQLGFRQDFLLYTEKRERVELSHEDSFEETVAKTNKASGGRTDCSQGIQYAIDEYMESEGKRALYDLFVYYTDSETNWPHAPHPVIALRKYRELTGIPAKMVVIGMVPNKFTIADPTDAGMLDVCGFDLNVPNVIQAFATGDGLPEGDPEGEVADVDIAEE